MYVHLIRQLTLAWIFSFSLSKRKGQGCCLRVLSGRQRITAFVAESFNGLCPVELWMSSTGLIPDATLICHRTGSERWRVLISFIRVFYVSDGLKSIPDKRTMIQTYWTMFNLRNDICFVLNSLNRWAVQRRVVPLEMRKKVLRNQRALLLPAMHQFPVVQTLVQLRQVILVFCLIPSCLSPLFFENSPWANMIRICDWKVRSKYNWVICGKGMTFE